MMKGYKKMRIVYTLSVLVILTAYPLLLRGQGQELKIFSNFGRGEWVDRDAELRLATNRVLLPAEGYLAVMVGAMDMTGLFVKHGKMLSYAPGLVPLPSGEHELVLYLIAPGNEWRELARFDLRVRSELGLDRQSLAQQINLNNAGQLAEGHNPDSNAPQRDKYQDFTGQATLNSEMIRGTFEVRSNWALAGASKKNQTLRFFEKGDNAAHIDLASYLIAVGDGTTNLSMGHINHGRQKHLINFYSSRGLLLESKIGTQVDMSAAVVNGTDIVGWNNFLGLSNANHRIHSGTIGIEFVPENPGAFRIEGSAMDASSQPLNNFNQGVINDAEQSKGIGFKMQGNTWAQRVRYEAGFARSRFVNPQDPFLAQGAAIVEVRPETKNARYADLTIGLLQNLSLGQEWQTNVNLNVRHERVDPLYRSLTAFAKADYLENALDLQANLGMINLQYSHARSEDNLDEIPSILKTKTRVSSVNAGLPLPYLFNPAKGAKSWLPSVAYSFNRVHQFAAGLPVNGGFSDGHLPDQVSDSHNASLNWQIATWSLGYQLSRNDQDNRQPGRENADFYNLNNSFTVSLSPFSRLNLNVDLSLEKAENKEQQRVDRTRRYGFGFNLQTTKASNLNVVFSTTSSEDDAKISENNDMFLNAQWSLNFYLKRSVVKNWMQGQVFIRYARKESSSKDILFGFDSELDNWTLNTGVNLSLF